MANKKINELSSRTPALSDLMIVGDPSSGYSYKATVTALATIIETDISDAFVTLSTTQTISGAKTFSNVITATSVANTPTDPDKFLTLNASNQVTYRTGAEVLSDIGGQGALTLTTTGTSGAATLVGNTLNIPQYTDQYTGTVTSVAASAGTGISISGSPITTSGTLTITNTAPDQVVALTGGTGISISGTYPNFTITNSSPSSGGTVTSVAMTVPTGLTVSGTPITSSGTLAVSLQTGYSIPTTASQTNWDSAYNDKINSASVTGTTTKTLTLTQQDGGTVTASWSDLDSGTITGSGTTNYIPKFTSSSAIGNSVIYESSGNVGINTTSNSYTAANRGNLNIAGTSSAILGFQLGGVAKGYLFHDGTNVQVGNEVNGALLFGTNASEQMRLTSTGLGIGTSSPVSKLHVVGEARVYTGSSLGYWGVDAGNSYVYFGTNTSNYSLSFQTSGAEKMRLDASGNLGLGVTPSAWISTAKAFQLNNTASLFAPSSEAILANNCYVNSADNNIYITSNYSTQYRQVNGQHIWYQAPSGTAGNAISFTQAMTLDASGRLGIGTTSPQQKLSVVGSGIFGSDKTGGSSYLTLTLAGGVSDTREIGYVYNAAASREVGSKISFVGDGNSGGNQGGYMTFSTSTAGDASISERMRITSGGLVGIGSSNPLTTLQINASTPTIRLEETSAGAKRLEFSVASDGLAKISANQSAQNLAFETVGSERMRITSGGELLINTTSDAGDYKLQVNGNSNFVGNIIATIDLYLSRTGTSPAIVLDQSQVRLVDQSTGYNTSMNVYNGGLQFGGSIKTAAPSGGTAKPWKLGQAGVSVGGANSTAVAVEIDGTTYYLLTAYLP
jgi:hypothetical protein